MPVPILFDAQQLILLLQWTDSAFPTGAFAHSGGLETYTQAGIVNNAADLDRLITVKLDTAAHTDLIVVHSAMTAFHAGDVEAIREMDHLCAATKPARETREASEKIGRRLLASVLNTYPDERLRGYQTEIERKTMIGHHAVVQGLIGAALGLDPRPVMLAFAYALAANQTAASLKLMSIGQTQAQAVLAGCGERITAAVEAALSRTLDDFNTFTPGLEIRAMQHEHLFRRLFIS